MKGRDVYRIEGLDEDVETMGLWFVDDPRGQWLVHLVRLRIGEPHRPSCSHGVRCVKAAGPIPVDGQDPFEWLGMLGFATAPSWEYQFPAPSDTYAAAKVQQRLHLAPAIGVDAKPYWDLVFGEIQGGYAVHSHVDDLLEHLHDQAGRTVH